MAKLDIDNPTETTTEEEKRQRLSLSSLDNPDPQSSKFSIEHDKLDKHSYKNMKRSSQKLDETVDEISRDFPTMDELSQDIFFSFYKYNPEMVDRENMKASHSFNHDIMEKSMNTKQYEKLRNYTQVDDMQSAISTVSFLYHLEESGMLDKFKDDINDMQQRQEQIDDLSEELKNFDDIPKSELSTRDTETELRERIKSLKKEQESMKQKVREKMDRNTSQNREAVRQSLEKAKEDSNSVDDMIRGWGLSNKEEKSLSWEDKMDLVKQIQDNEKLKKIAKMIGRMKRLMMSQQKSKVNKVPEEVQNIKQGNDLSHMLPSEALYLLSDKSKKYWYKKLSSHELLQYELKGKERKGEGAIIACVDTSGSMEGDREIWAKSVSIALYNLARRQNRDFYGILFSNASSPEEALKEIEIKYDEGSERTEKIMDFLQSFLDGGTNFNYPLRRAVDVIKTNQDYKKADILFVTDGQAKVDSAVLEDIERLKERLDFSIYGIGVGFDAGGLKDFADNIFSVNDIMDEGNEVAEDIFQFI